jgi:hypothetical protein
MAEKDGAEFSQKQPYDTSFKAFVDKVTLELLSFLTGMNIFFADELVEPRS